MEEKSLNEAKDDELVSSDLLTAVEVANKLRISTASLSNYRRDGTGPTYIKVGRHYKYPQKAVMEFLKKQVNI